MTPREELEALRRMAELEARAAGAAPSAPAPAPESLPGPRQQVSFRNPMTGQPINVDVGAAKELLQPTVEMLGAVGGGALGSAGGPLGSVLGAGTGYALAKQFMEPVGPVEATKRILEGATMEAGGRVAAPIVEKAIGAGAKMVGKVMDLPNLAKIKAGKIAREALGPELDSALTVLKNADPNMTAAEALNRAGVVSPQTYALLEKALGRDPRFIMVRELTEQAGGENALARIAGGATQTAARATQEQAVKNLSQLTEPQKQAALGAANLGAAQQGMAQTAAAARQEAAGAVGDVRRFVRAGEEAAPRVQAEISGARFPGEARTPFKFSYMSDLAQRADDVANLAAQRSLDAGGIARANEDAVRALDAYGIKPLTPDSVISQIRARLSDPQLAGNKPLESALQEVEAQIARWTGANGIIDARALDAIRKNAVNSISLQFSQGNPTLQKQVASDLTASLKPAIINAIEEAGGKGYAKYLADYSKARQVIDQKALGAEALNLYRTNKAEFVRLVEGNTPDAVEKIFGPGSYDIAKELSSDALATVKGLAQKIKTGEAVAAQATKGQDALRELLAENASRFRFPAWLDFRAAAANKALSELEQKLGKKVWAALTEGAKSGQNLDRILSQLPATERKQALNVLTSPEKWGIKPAIARGTIEATRNALAPEPENAFAR